MSVTAFACGSKFGVGSRLCSIIDEAIRFDVDRLLGALISLGVADAKRLEEALARGIWERSLSVTSLEARCMYVSA